MRQRFKGLRRLAVGLATLGMVSLGATVVAAPTSGAAAVTKTVITFAEAPGASPNYIFPFTTLGHFSVANLSQFQQFMYRPLYWFGKGSTPTINPKLSLAGMPKSSNGNKTFTVTLKTYKWSNGEKVTSTDVLFWMNIWHSKPTGFAGWFPGGLSMPTSVKAVKITSPTTFTLSFKRSFNPHWLLYNELSEITPMPKAWTRTSLTAAPGSAGCFNAPFGTNDTACKAVYLFLSEQSGYNPTSPTTKINALPTYATSKIWSVVDGPWKLKTFTASGNDTFTANLKYTGPTKPTYKNFVVQNFTSDTAEVNSLFAHQSDIGWLNSQNTTYPAKSTTVPGKNNPRLSPYYNLKMAPTWAIAYGLYNFTSTGDHGQAGKILRQLYIRQAMQRLVDQPLYVKKLMKGYGSPTYGPVPVLPKNPFVTKYETKNPYPYNPAKARQLLKSHGWSVVPGGTDVCQVAAKCGVPKGTKLDLTMSWAVGQTFFQQQVTAEKDEWATAGIHVTLIPGSFTTVAGDAVPSNHKWEIANYGLWIFAPDYYPTGELLFQTGAGSNAGSYSDPVADKLIKLTNTSSNNKYFAQYENYLAKQLPYLWQPNTIGVDEVSKQLTGFVPNSLDAILPETWHLKK